MKVEGPLPCDQGDLYRITHHNKRLELTLYEKLSDDPVLARVSIFNKFGLRWSGTTTAAYKVARGLMIERAKEVGQVQYMFISSVPTMMEWAKTKGQQVFGWDMIETISPQDSPNEKFIKASKLFIHNA